MDVKTQLIFILAITLVYGVQGTEKPLPEKTAVKLESVVKPLVKTITTFVETENTKMEKFIDTALGQEAERLKKLMNLVKNKQDVGKLVSDVVIKNPEFHKMAADTSVKDSAQFTKYMALVGAALAQKIVLKL